MDRNEIVVSSPARNPRLVRAGSYEVTVAAGDEPWRAEGARKTRQPIHIHTTKVMSHTLAQELRSRAHTLKTEEATES